MYGLIGGLWFGGLCAGIIFGLIPALVLIGIGAIIAIWNLLTEKEQQLKTEEHISNRPKYNY